MATTWLPKHRFRTARQYLLANGEVIEEPDLEESSSGVRIRIAGTTKSVYKRHEDELVKKGLEMAASRRRTQFWMPVDLNDGALNRSAGFTPAEVKARFEPTTRRSKALAWWSFKHPTLPIKALLIVQWYNDNDYAEGHRITTALVVPNQQVKGLNPLCTKVIDPEFDQVRRTLDDSDAKEAFDEFIREDGGVRLDLLGVQSDLIERKAVGTLLKQVRAAEELEEIQIPDLRLAGTHHQFDWLTLKLDETNVNGRFMQDISEYLSGTATAERALELYKELVGTLRTLGMVMGTNLRENQLMEAMLSGDTDALVVQVSTAVGDDGKTRDPKHPISVHLPTGTFVVSCPNETEDKDKIAHAWEESRMLADLTGKEDELLAYARQYVNTNHNRRTKKIVAQRIDAQATN